MVPIIFYKSCFPLNLRDGKWLPTRKLPNHRYSSKAEVLISIVVRLPSWLSWPSRVICVTNDLVDLHGWSVSQSTSLTFTEDLSQMTSLTFTENMSQITSLAFTEDICHKSPRAYLFVAIEISSFVPCSWCITEYDLTSNYNMIETHGVIIGAGTVDLLWNPWVCHLF